MDWISIGIMIFGFAFIGWGFWVLGLAIRDLQRKIESITQLPPERIKYVVVYEKESERLK